MADIHRERLDEVLSALGERLMLAGERTHLVVIGDRELRDAARWARTHNMPGPFGDELAQALADFGVEDDGRDA
jgi:hypothetical protein